MSFNPTTTTSSTTISTPSHCPDSLLGATMDSFGDMDPDLMFGASQLGYFREPNWQQARVEVIEDFGAEAERLLSPRGDEGEDSFPTAATTDDGRDGPTDKKRRWSARLSETLVGFGRRVKLRAGSLGLGLALRRDSGFERGGGLVREGHGGSSEEALVGSGERSRDGGDELSEEEEEDEDEDLSRPYGRPFRDSIALSRERWREKRERDARRRVLNASGAEFRYPGSTRPLERFRSVENPLSRTVVVGNEEEHVRQGRRQRFLECRKDSERMMKVERALHRAFDNGVFRESKRDRAFEKAPGNQKTTEAAQWQASRSLIKKMESRERMDRAPSDSSGEDSRSLSRMRGKLKRFVAVRWDSSAEVSGTSEGSGIDRRRVRFSDSEDEGRQDLAKVAWLVGMALPVPML